MHHPACNRVKNVKYDILPSGYDNYNSILESVRKGIADAALIDVSIVSYLQKKQNMSGLVVTHLAQSTIPVRAIYTSPLAQMWERMRETVTNNMTCLLVFKKDIEGYARLESSQDVQVSKKL